MSKFCFADLVGLPSSLELSIDASLKAYQCIFRRQLRSKHIDHACVYSIRIAQARAVILLLLLQHSQEQDICKCVFNGLACVQLLKQNAEGCIDIIETRCTMQARQVIYIYIQKKNIFTKDVGMVVPKSQKQGAAFRQRQAKAGDDSMQQKYMRNPF